MEEAGWDSSQRAVPPDFQARDPVSVAYSERRTVSTLIKQQDHLCTFCQMSDQAASDPRSYRRDVRQKTIDRHVTHSPPGSKDSLESTTNCHCQSLRSSHHQGCFCDLDRPDVIIGGIIVLIFRLVRQER